LITSKAQKSHGGEIWTVWLHGWIVEFPIQFFQAGHRIQLRNPDAPLRKYLLRHSKNGSFKTTVTQTIRTVRRWRSCKHYVTLTTTTWHNIHRLPLHNSGALPPVHEFFKWPS
jgi:hypothetical protein